MRDASHYLRRFPATVWTFGATSTRLIPHDVVACVAGQVGPFHPLGRSEAVQVTMHGASNAPSRCWGSKSISQAQIGSVRRGAWGFCGHFQGAHAPQPHRLPVEKLICAQRGRRSPSSDCSHPVAAKFARQAFLDSRAAILIMRPALEIKGACGNQELTNGSEPKVSRADGESFPGFLSP
jgi:hypothetical protein